MIYSLLERAGGREFFNGGSPQNLYETTYTVESNSITLQDPVKQGWKFNGWNTLEKFNGDTILQLPTGSTGNIKLYARWLPTLELLETIKYRDLRNVTGGTFLQEHFGDSFEHTISSFEMAAYEITYELWYTVRIWAEQNGYPFANLGQEGSHGKIGEEPTVTRKNEPVVNINWKDAIMWCNAYSEMNGHEPCYIKEGKVIRTYLFFDPECNWKANGYRLPSEGEWLYAASYIDGVEWLPSDFASGSRDNYKNEVATNEVAWYKNNANGKTQTVGQKKANALGIYDMSGNIFEWCWDNYESYPKSAKVDYRTKFSSTYKVQRGGGYTHNNEYLRLGSRSLAKPDEKEKNYGFRLARSID